ncbi:hypothetical protein ACFO72_004310 [Enterobacter roggenkampii]
MSGEASVLSFDALPMETRVQLAKTAFSSLLKRPPYRGDVRARQLNVQIAIIAEAVARTGAMADEFCALYDRLASGPQRKSIIELKQIMDDFQQRLSQV